MRIQRLREVKALAEIDMFRAEPRFRIKVDQKCHHGLSLGDRIVGDFEFIFYTYFEFCNFLLKGV